MNDLSKKFSGVNTEGAVPRSQLSLEEQMIEEDLNRHKKFFASLTPNVGKKNGLVGVFGAVAIVLGALSTAYVLNQSDIGTKPSSAVADCDDFQVKVYTTSGFICENCKAGEYGKLNLCEKDSPSKVCEVQENGCFKPKF